MYSSNRLLQMIAVITGDIINSKKMNPKAWLKPLKTELDTIGDTPKIWEIYRGDSFQAIINNAGRCFKVRDKN